MKNFIYLIVLLLSLSCHETSESSKRKSHPFDKTVGMQIPVSTADSWMNNYRNSSARVANDHNINAALLNSLITSANYQGVTFHYAIDESGQEHILLSMMDESYNMLKGKIIDSNTGEVVDNGIAQIWISNFQSKNLKSVWFHFFGSEIINEILSTPNFQRLELKRALNYDGDQQLVLYAYRITNDNGRSKGETFTTYDAGSPCPPCPK